MKRLILLAFIGTFLIKDVTLSKIHKYPANLIRLFASGSKLNNEEDKRTVCETEECKNMAKTILGGIDKSVDPCEDFYEYACGNWPKNNPLPQGYHKWSMLAKLQVKTDEQVDEIVKAKSTENDLEVVKLARKWFKACSDTDAKEKEGINPLVSTLSRLGGWPMIMEPDKWDEQKYSWQKVDDDYVHLTGRNAFHDVRIDEDDSTIVVIDTPHLPPGSKKLRSLIEADGEEDEKEDDGETGNSKSDEDPSDEEEQSKEKPGSEGEDSKFIANDDDDDDDDDDDGSGNDDNDDDDDTDEQDEDFKKKIGKKKDTNKVSHGKNKKLQHVKERKNTNRIKKHNSHNQHHKIKRQRIKKQAISEVDNKRMQHLSRLKKLHTRKNTRDHVRKVHRKRARKMLDNGKTYTTAIPQVSTKEMKIIRQYADYISKVARVIAKEEGIEISQERLDEDIQDMIDFQINLIQIMPSDSIFNELFSLEVTLKDFQQWYNKKNPKTTKSKIDWVDKIKTLFDEVNEPVDDDLNLNIMSPKYIQDLLSLLDKTSNRTVVNYIHWNFISRIIKATTGEMIELYNSWQKATTGETQRIVTQDCLKSAEIKDILAYEFVRKYFSNDIMKTASNMINDIRNEVKYLIKQSDWMDDEAKDFALAKVKNMKEFIGYPDWFKNTTIIQQYYKGLDITSSYYENIIRYKKYTKQKSLRKLSKNNEETNKDEEINPVEVNAFYIPWRNALAITAADFQSPWFSYDRPRSVNFGIIGFIIAHEVNHGFDENGHKYDKNGDFLGWFSSMANSYDKKQDCFVNQFNNYPIEKKTNKTIKDYGKQTVGDNIADTMGLQAIFKAYQRKEEKSEISDAVLPGMEDFTNNQLFFLSFANLWCESIDQNLIMELAKDDDHSTNRLRIIGSVSNSDDFAKAFNCPVGSPMNPEKKCNIWK